MKSIKLSIIIFSLVLAYNIGFSQNSKAKFCDQLEQLLQYSKTDFEDIRGEIMESGQRRVKRYATDFWFARGGFPYLEYKENSWYYISQYYSTPEIDKGYVQLERLKKNVQSCLGDKWKIEAYESEGITNKYIFKPSKDTSLEISLYLVYDGKYSTIYFQIMVG